MCIYMYIYVCVYVFFLKRNAAKSSKDLLTERGISNSSMLTPGCIVTSAGNINCRNTVYTDPKVWRANRENVDEQIRSLRNQLEGLKVFHIFSIDTFNPW